MVKLKMLLSLSDTTKVQNIFDICKHLSKKMHLFSLNYVNEMFPETEQFCSQIEQNVSNLFQLQTDIYRNQKRETPGPPPTYLRISSDKGKFAPLRTLGWALATGR